MVRLFEIAAGVADLWSLLGFAIAAVVYVGVRRRGPVTPIVWFAITAIVVIALAPILAGVYVRTYPHEESIYRVRVTILDLRQVPVEDAKVWSSIGGEPKKVAGGWQFDIPATSKPADGKLTMYASVPSAFLTGQQELLVGADFFPTATVQLAKDTSATVKGFVVDGSLRAIEGVRVSVVGFEQEAVLTESGGSFRLPAHAADGQQVQLHVEKPGYAAVNQWHLAGVEPATILLDNK